MKNWRLHPKTRSVIQENDRNEQRKLIKYNHLVANCMILHNVSYTKTSAAVVLAVMNNFLQAERWSTNPAGTCRVCAKHRMQDVSIVLFATHSSENEERKITTDPSMYRASLRFEASVSISEAARQPPPRRRAGLRAKPKKHMLALNSLIRDATRLADGAFAWKLSPRWANRSEHRPA